MYIDPASGNRLAGSGYNATAFVLDQTIGSGSNWLGNGAEGTLREYKYSGSGNWPNNQERFAGLRFGLPDGNHYGWARVSVNVNASSLSFTLHDWAYESEAGVSVLAGAVPPPPAEVPEPSSLALFALGAVGLAAWRRSRKGRTA